MLPMLLPVNEEGIKLFVSLQFSSLALALTGIREADKPSAFPTLLSLRAGHTTHPWSSSVLLFSLLAPFAIFRSATSQMTGVMFLLFSFRLFSLSSFSLLLSPPECTYAPSFCHLTLTSPPSSPPSEPLGVLPFPTLGPAVVFSAKQLCELAPPFLGHLGISCHLQKSHLMCQQVTLVLAEGDKLDVISA